MIKNKTKSLIQDDIGAEISQVRQRSFLLELIEWFESLLKILSATFIAFTMIGASYFIKRYIHIEDTDFIKIFFKPLFIFIALLPLGYLLAIILRIKHFIVVFLVFAWGLYIIISAWIVFFYFQTAKDCEIGNTLGIKEWVCIDQKISNGGL